MDLIKMGLCIKRHREKLGISLEELAQKAGIDVEVLLSYERGEIKPNYKELERISKEIDVPMVMLVHGGGTERSRYIDSNGKFVCEAKEY